MTKKRDCVWTASDCACNACTCACAACIWACARSSAAWLMYCFWNNCFWRSSSLLLRFKLARAASTCAALAAAFWLAARASMRSNSCPALTRSPALTLKLMIAPGTWADSVVWRTASTTPSKLMRCASAAPEPAIATVASATGAASAAHAAGAATRPASIKALTREVFNIQCS